VLENLDVGFGGKGRRRMDARLLLVERESVKGVAVATSVHT
jgi:hypothetical protein